MKKLSKYDSIYKTAVSKWEEENERNFDGTAQAMLSNALEFIRKQQKHFPEEIQKINESEIFEASLLDSLRFSLLNFILSGNDDMKLYGEETRESWAYTSSLLLKMRNLYRQIPEARRDVINAHLKVRDTGQLPDDLGVTLMQARLICARWGNKLETRGRKAQPFSILVVRVAENIEDTFGRNLSRSYDVFPDNLFENCKTAFTNHDLNLVYVVSRVVIHDITIENVKSAMKNHFSRPDQS